MPVLPAKLYKHTKVSFHVVHICAQKNGKPQFKITIRKRIKNIALIPIHNYH